jgi:pantoate--beta-alanine ligase
MKILLNSAKLKKELKNNQSLGFVPTMGTIHKGHEHLISISKKNNKKTIVSIFINPTQFNDLKDFKKYPKNLKKDLIILKRLKVDFVFIPKTKDIYRYKRIKKIKLAKKSLILCAKFRKGHFEGVLDVMDRLTRIIYPRNIYMGEKDFQQYYLVKNFIEKKYFTKIVKCKTIRNRNGVALSSRNLLLSKASLEIAAKIVFQLRKIKKRISKQVNIKKYLEFISKDLAKKYKIKIDYLELRNETNLFKSTKIKNSRLFISYYLSGIRLIDNL